MKRIQQPLVLYVLVVVCELFTIFVSLMLKLTPLE